jgi:glycosyltransferase involved in cell wall biosynthesis
LSIKILFICSHLRPGGLERQLVELVNKLVEKEIKVSLLLLEDKIHYNLSSKVRIHKIVSQSKVKQIIEIRSIIRSIDFNIIHSWGPVPSTQAMIISIMHRKPHIASYIRNCERPNKLSLKWLRFLLLKLNCSYITSNTREGLRLYDLVNHKKGKCIYNGFNLERLNRNNNLHPLFKTYNSFLRGKKIVLMIASFYRTKDWETFIKLAEINKTGDIVFLGIGDGPNYKTYKNKSINHKNILFPGAQKDIELIIKNADACLLLSEKEGLSNVITEYMALKKATIVTSKGGTSELVVNGHSGFICSFGDVKSVNEKVHLLIKNESFSNQMGELGFEIIKTKFNIDEMVSKYINLYKEVIS